VTLPQIHSTLVVVAAGVDPGGGAGLLRDLLTVRALGARAEGIETAGTLQGPAVHQVDPRSPESVRRALAQAIATLRPGAVKIGMAVGPATAAALIEGLGDYAGPVVVDPVLQSSRGGPLWAGAARELLPLLRRATVATPNAGEAAALSGLPVTTCAEAGRAGRRLVDGDGLRAVLVKGGHLAGSDGPVTDVLVSAMESSSSRGRGSQGRSRAARDARSPPRSPCCWRAASRWARRSGTRATGWRRALPRPSPWGTSGTSPTRQTRRGTSRSRAKRESAAICKMCSS
jgi:hydroxymethylpyrimidine/phosphomethylpyrimidine kinase